MKKNELFTEHLKLKRLKREIVIRADVRPESVVVNWYELTK